jgi:hypothetical protein
MLILKKIQFPEPITTAKTKIIILVTILTILAIVEGGEKKKKKNWE